jgi:hypothetical protein
MKLVISAIASLALVAPVYACPNVDHGPGHDDNAPRTADKDKAPAKDQKDAP